MAASKLTVDRGTTYSITLNYKRNGVPASLVSATVRFTVKSNEYDTDDTDTTALVKKNVTSHTDPANGVTVIALIPTDTQDITPGNYFYDIKVKDASGNVYKVDKGKFGLDGSPTNRLV